MVTSLLDMPTELVDMIAFADPTIIPNLRASCHEMDSKTRHAFLETFFENASFHFTPESMRRLAEMSRNQGFASAVKSLRLSGGMQGPNAFEAALYELQPPAEVRLLGLELLQIVLRELNRCTAVEVEVSDHFLLRPDDINQRFVDLARAIANSSASMTKLSWASSRGDSGICANVPLDYLSCAVRTVSPCALATLETLEERSIMLSANVALHKNPDHDNIDEYGCRVSHEAINPALTTVQQNAQHFFSHLRNVKHLRFSMDCAWGSWLPASFGAALETMRIHEQGHWSIGEDGGQALAKVLGQSPKLHALGVFDIWFPDLRAAKDFTINMGDVPGLKRLTLGAAAIGDVHDYICSGKSCAGASRHKTQWIAAEWVIEKLPEFGSKWAGRMHEHPSCCIHLVR